MGPFLCCKVVLGPYQNAFFYKTIATGLFSGGNGGYIPMLLHKKTDPLVWGPFLVYA